MFIIVLFVYLKVSNAWVTCLILCNRSVLISCSYPDVIRRYREMGGELITVGSDGHVPEYLGYGFDRLPELLSDCGFDSYTVFRQGKPEFRKVLVKI